MFNLSPEGWMILSIITIAVIILGIDYFANKSPHMDDDGNYTPSSLAELKGHNHVD